MSYYCIIGLLPPRSLLPSQTKDQEEPSGSG
jgi:hypothetical protein